MKKALSNSPFKKPWGLHKDGDLWEQIWEAIHKRGLYNQQIRWVKGHATDKQVEEGISSQRDQYGNDRSDTNAKAAVEHIGGKGPHQACQVAHWEA